MKPCVALTTQAITFSGFTVCTGNCLDTCFDRGSMLEMQATRRLLSFMQDMHQCDRSSGRMSLSTNDEAFSDLVLGQVIQSADVQVIAHIVVLLLRFSLRQFSLKPMLPHPPLVCFNLLHTGVALYDFKGSLFDDKILSCWAMASSDGGNPFACLGLRASTAVVKQAYRALARMSP